MQNDDKHSLEQPSGVEETSFSIPHMTIRLGAGIYLLYLAWDLRGAAFTGPRGTLFGIGMIVFALAGLGLAGHAMWKLSDHYRKGKSDET